MNRKSTKEVLANSFWELLDKKPVIKISVQEITIGGQCSVSTFYRCFRDKTDLMSWTYQALLYETVGPIDGFMDNFTRSIRMGIEACQKNKKRLKNLILNTEGQDSFAKIMSYKKYGVSCRMHPAQIQGKNGEENSRLYPRLLQRHDCPDM